MYNGYQKTIKEATNCDDSELDEIEDFMRDIIFHSTLDWQTHEEFVAGARKAHEVLRYMRARKKKAKRKK